MKKEKKICPNCSKSFSNRHPTAIYCLACMDWNKRHPLAGWASGLVNQSIMRGELPRADSLLCTDCGEQARDYDHRDYTRPLDVEPTCRSCNNFRGSAYPYIKSAGKLSMRLSDYR